MRDADSPVVTSIPERLQDLILRGNATFDLVTVEAISVLQELDLVPILVLVQKIPDLFVVDFYHADGEFVLHLLRAVLNDSVDLVDRSEIETWVSVVSHHCVGLSGACLTVGHYADIISLHTRLNQGLNLLEDFNLVGLLMEHLVELELLGLILLIARGLHPVRAQVFYVEHLFLAFDFLHERPHSANDADVALVFLELI